MKASKQCLIAICVILPLALAGCAGAASAPAATPAATAPTLSTTAAAEASRIQLWGQDYWYLLGVNYPWLNYGHDFGTTAWGHDGVSATASTGIVESDFTYLQSQGVHVARWFLFGDGRASPEFDADGRVTGFDEYFYPDLDAALAIAQKHDIYLIMVLFDFHLADKAKDVDGVQLGGHSQVISDPEKRQSFLDNALKPLLERYAENRSIIAWEVVNEPEGAMKVPGGQWVAQPVSVTAMQDFVKDVTHYIHYYSSQYATVGSASRGSLHYWTGSGLDFYQYHYYDKMEGQYPLAYACANLGLDKPCIVGEFPTKNTIRSMAQYLDIIWNNGCAGALAWSYRAGDDASDFKSVAGQFATWSNAHASVVSLGAK